MTNRGARNLQNLVQHGFDLISIAPDPVFWRRAMRHGFLQFGNWCKSTELALFAGVPRVALEIETPLIFWGENPALQLGDLGALGSAGWDGNQVVQMNTLQGGDVSWLIPIADGLHNLVAYQYPSLDEVSRAGLQTVYLGWVLGDWGLARNGDISSALGLDTRYGSSIDYGDPSYVTSLDEDWVAVNQMVKYLKFGFGRATDLANEYIREGGLSRNAAVHFVQTNDGRCDEKLVQSFCHYLGLTIDQFWQTVGNFANYQLFSRESLREFVPLFNVGEDLVD